MKQMLIDANQDDEVRVAIIDKNDLIDYESENFKNDRVKGNIYLAKIIRVELPYRQLLLTMVPRNRVFSLQ